MTKILFLASNPMETDRLRLDVEAREIERHLQGFLYSDQLSFVTAWAVQADDLIFVIDRHSPSILHFSGHGCRDTGFILADGNAVDADNFKRLLTIVGSHIDLVVLNYRDSAAQAIELSKHVEYVIYTTDSVADEAAINFSNYLYLAIAYGHNYEDAFARAQYTLKLKKIDCWNRWSILINASTPEERNRQLRRSGENNRRLLESDTAFRREWEQSRKRQWSWGGRPNPYTSTVVRGQEKAFNDLVVARRVESLRTNHKSLYDAVCSVGQELIRLTGGLGFIVMDIDDLTLINKHHGFAVGTFVLRELIAVTEAHFPNCIVSRCGDDTVMIVFGKILLNELMNISDKLCDDINGYKWNASNEGLFVSCTAGFSVCGTLDKPFDAFIRAAIGMSEGKRIAKGCAHPGPLHLPASYYYAQHAPENAYKTYIRESGTEHLYTRLFSGQWVKLDTFITARPPHKTRSQRR